MSVYPAALPTVRPAVRSAFEQGSGGGAASIIAGLFSAGQQGFWLPFTDFASLSQDSAGTLPYTALEQPVGRVLDRSGRGNHASQVTSTARGVVSARVNALRNSADFSSIDWLKEKSGSGSPPVVTANYGVAPDGTMTAARVQMTLNGGVGNGDWSRLQHNANPIAKDAVYSCDFWIRSLTGAAQVIMREEFSQIGLQVKNITAEWAKYTITGTATALFANFGLWLRGASGMATADLDILVWGPSISLQSQSPLPYQRVNTPTDYDSVGFPKYLRLDGTDDYYTCGGGGSTTGFYYSDVVRPMGGAGTRRVIWSDRSGNNGYELAINTANKLEFGAGNGTAITTVASTVSAAVAEGKRYEVMDDGTNLSVQIDGSAPVTIARPVVTAGSPTITLYRGASTGYFNGQITEPIYRAGPPPSASERATIMGYQKQKAGL